MSFVINPNHSTKLFRKKKKKTLRSIVTFFWSKVQIIQQSKRLYGWTSIHPCHKLASYHLAIFCTFHVQSDQVDLKFRASVLEKKKVLKSLLFVEDWSAPFASFFSLFCFSQTPIYTNCHLLGWPRAARFLDPVWHFFVQYSEDVEKNYRGLFINLLGKLASAICCCVASVE